jgi:hypothetical protein
MPSNVTYLHEINNFHIRLLSKTLCVLIDRRKTLDQGGILPSKALDVSTEVT